MNNLLRYPDGPYIFQKLHGFEIIEFEKEDEYFQIKKSHSQFDSDRQLRSYSANPIFPGVPIDLRTFSQEWQVSNSLTCHSCVWTGQFPAMPSCFFGWNELCAPNSFPIAKANA